MCVQDTPVGRLHLQTLAVKSGKPSKAQLLQHVYNSKMPGSLQQHLKFELNSAGERLLISFLDLLLSEDNLVAPEGHEIWLMMSVRRLCGL